MFISEVFYIFLERDLTMKIESYKSHGKTKYRFRAFLGKDVVTGKQHRVFKSGFDTRKEVGLNSPSLWPTMFSVISTGTCILPL